MKIWISILTGAVGFIVLVLVGTSVVNHIGGIHESYHEEKQDDNIAASKTAADGAFTEARAARTEVASLSSNVVANADAIRAQAAEVERVGDKANVLGNRVTAAEGDVDTLRRRAMGLESKVDAAAASAVSAHNRLNSLPSVPTVAGVANELKSDPDFVRATTGPQGYRGYTGPQGPQGPRGYTGAAGPQGPPGRTVYVRSCY